MRRQFALTIFLVAGFIILSGCSNTDARSQATEETIEFNGVSRKVSELSEDTLQWIEWYQSLPEEQQAALSFVPSGFDDNRYTAAVENGDEEGTAGQAEMIFYPDSTGYLEALSEEDLIETEEIARYYFTELSPVYDGVEHIEPAEDDNPLYQNVGIEAEYTVGNIIIYLVETGKDREEGNPVRTISIARASKSDEWKVINSGF